LAATRRERFERGQAATDTLAGEDVSRWSRRRQKETDANTVPAPFE
jgi:hypothetical protein